jgi:hypothetical protein
MELRIGVVQSPREIELELDSTVDEVVKLIDDGFASGNALVWVTDSKGRKVGVNVEKIAYVEVDDGASSRTVGFGR